MHILKKNIIKVPIRGSIHHRIQYAIEKESHRISCINQKLEGKQNLNYSATWLPNYPVSLGDIGTMDNYQFTRINNIESAFGIHFKTKLGAMSYNPSYYILFKI
jgi:hypothetical protein